MSNYNNTNIAHALWTDRNTDGTNSVKGRLRTTDMKTFKFAKYTESFQADKTVEATIKRIAAMLNNKKAEIGRNSDIYALYNDDDRAKSPYIYSCFECARSFVYSDNKEVTLYTRGKTEHEAMIKNDVLMNNIIAIATYLPKEE